MGHAALGGSCERGNVPSFREAPSVAGGSAGAQRELQRLGGECSGGTVAGGTETCADGPGQGKLNDAEGRISDLEDEMMELALSEHQTD